MSHRFLLAVALVMVTLAACSDNRTASDNGRAALENVVAAYDSSTAHGDAEGMIRLYRPDVVVLSPQSPEPAVGLEVNRSAWLRFFSMPNARHTMTTDDIVVSEAGDIAYTYGTWTASVDLPDGTPVPGSGPLVTIWRREPATGGREAGEWRAAVVMAHQSQ